MAKSRDGGLFDLNDVIIEQALPYLINHAAWTILRVGLVCGCKGNVLNKMKMLFAVLALITFISTQSFAAEEGWHPSLKKFEEDGGAVDFMGHAYGLDGWVVTTKEGDVKYVYTNKEGGLVVGMMIGADGQFETGRQLTAMKLRKAGSQAAMPGADMSRLSKVEQVYAKVEKSSWVRFGKEDAPYFYMFANVNCEHCQNFWKDIEAAVNAGSIQVRFVPFGAKPDNLEGGAALLSVADPLDAWKKYVAGDKSALSKDKITAGGLEKIAANSALFKDNNMQGPPFSIYRRPQDAVVTVLVGRPKNSMLLIADLMKKGQ